MRKIQHIIEAQQFDLELLNEIFLLTRKMADWVIKEHYGKLSSEEKERMQKGVKGKRMISLFYEESTRTRASFEIAMRILGGQVVFSTKTAGEFSYTKGETLEDTIRVLSMYFPDIIVLRYFEAGGAARAIKFTNVPIINAGDGPGQHPTQALLDIYTIWERLGGKVDGLSVAMVGDLANGRTVRSLSYLLGKYQNIIIYYVSPDMLRIGQDIKDYLNRHDVDFVEIDDLREIADRVDVIYQTRIQRERLGDQVFSYDEVREKCSISKQVLEKLPRHGIIMHPLPRNPEDEELPLVVDQDQRAAYFPQAQNGLFVRMALLKMILGPD